VRASRRGNDQEGDGDVILGEAPIEVLAGMSSEGDGCGVGPQGSWRGRGCSGPLRLCASISIMVYLQNIGLPMHCSTLRFGGTRGPDTTPHASSTTPVNHPNAVRPETPCLARIRKPEEHAHDDQPWDTSKSDFCSYSFAPCVFNTAVHFKTVAGGVSRQRVLQQWSWVKQDGKRRRNESI